MGIPIVEIKKEKGNLNVCIQENHKKKLATFKSGLREDELYKPIWIYNGAMEVFSTLEKNPKVFSMTTRDRESC